MMMMIYFKRLPHGSDLAPRRLQQQVFSHMTAAASFTHNQQCSRRMSPLAPSCNPCCQAQRLESQFYFECPVSSMQRAQGQPLLKHHFY
jgi:hypothetical protein